MAQQLVDLLLLLYIQYFRYLCASDLSFTAMDKQHCVAYTATDATDTCMETSTQQHLSPAIECNISAVSYDNPEWHTDFCKECKVLHHVRYFKLYTYV